jgi:hypothetical protein
MGYKIICGMKLPACNKCGRVSFDSLCPYCFEEMLDHIDGADKALKNFDMDSFKKEVKTIQSYLQPVSEEETSTVTSPPTVKDVTSENNVHPLFEPLLAILRPGF